MTTLPTNSPAQVGSRGVWRLLVVALSVSIGWGIRGNFGHEIGAMLPGALAAMAAVIFSGREDWHRRVAYFGCAGALGWSLGGSMSYMQVIGYTHSGDSLSVFYGFTCLFVLGFLWAAPGGMATALPAFLTREQLSGFIAPLAAVATVWIGTTFAVDYWDHTSADFRQESPLYWYDTSWIEALGVIVALLGLAAIRRRWDFASSLLMHAAIGWWIAFLVLVPGLGLRMTPPRGDNWAGAIGIVLGMVIFFHRRRIPEMNYAALVTGSVGGIGFAGATLLKLCGVATGWNTNWHSVLEQSYGFINGIGVAIVMFKLARVVPPVSHRPEIRSWTDPFAAGLAVLGVAYLNLRQNSRTWVENKAMPDSLYGLSVGTWHEVAWILLGLGFVLIAISHRQHPLALIPTSWLGVGQGLYLGLLWIMVAGNFMRALPGFSPQRLVTEGVIHLNAVVCTVAILLLTPISLLPQPGIMAWPTILRRTTVQATLAALVCIVGTWACVRLLYGDKFAGSARLHIRFGPHATATTAKPAKGQPHP